MVGVPHPRIPGMCCIPFDRVLQGESNEPKIVERARGVDEKRKSECFQTVENSALQHFSPTHVSPMRGLPAALRNLFQDLLLIFHAPLRHVNVFRRLPQLLCMSSDGVRCHMTPSTNNADQHMYRKLVACTVQPKKQIRKINTTSRDRAQ